MPNLGTGTAHKENEQTNKAPHERGWAEKEGHQRQKSRPLDRAGLVRNKRTRENSRNHDARKEVMKSGQK